MRGRKQAAIVATVSAAVPLLFWISAATVVLTTLRKGWAEGLYLLLWAGLPAVLWLVMRSDPTPLLVIGGSMGLAVILRATMSWAYTLMGGVLLGLLMSWLLPVLMPELMAEIIRVSKEVMVNIAQDSASQLNEQMDVWLNSLFSGFLGAVHLLAIVLCLILGRWWQSVLFNPGGFGDEFQRLLLPAAVTIPAILVAVFGSGLHPSLLGWAPILTVPLFIAGIALVHGVVSLKKMSPQWLVAFYLLVFFVGPYFYVLLVVMAVLDSLLNFRRRIQVTP